MEQAETEFVICTQCKEALPRSMFRADTRKRNGLFSWCRPCVNKGGKRYRDSNREKYLEGCRSYYRKRKRDDPEFDAKLYAKYERKFRDKNLKKWYGISVDIYEHMLLQQNGVCAICKQPEQIKRLSVKRRLGVDHNHATGQVRGLLCHHCNAAIGYVREDAQQAIAIARYLEEWAATI